MDYQTLAWFSLINICTAAAASPREAKSTLPREAAAPLRQAVAAPVREKDKEEMTDDEEETTDDEEEITDDEEETTDDESDVTSRPATSSPAAVPQKGAAPLLQAYIDLIINLAREARKKNIESLINVCQ